MRAKTSLPASDGDTDLLSAALFAARNGDIGSLHSALVSAEGDLDQHRYEILDALPETIPPADYEYLLPVVNNEATEADEPDSLKAQEARQISEWYSQRIRAIEALSGQVEHSLALAEFAVESGADIGSLLTDVQQLEVAVYERGRDFTLAQWEKMDLKKRLEGLAQLEPVQDIVPSMKAEVFQKICSGAAHDDIISQFIQRVATVNLEAAVVALEACPDPKLLSNAATKVNTALEVAYTCTLTDQWALLHRLKECINSETNPRFQQMAQELKAHITAAETLSKYNMKRTVGALRDMAQKSDAAKKASTLLRNFADRAAARESISWDSFYDDIQNVVTALPMLDSEEANRVYLAALLRARRYDLAWKKLDIVTPSTASDIVAEAARAVVDSISDLSAPEEDAIEDARECLELAPVETDAIVAERDFLNALDELNLAGATWPPAALRSNPLNYLVKHVSTEHGQEKLTAVLKAARFLKISAEETAFQRGPLSAVRICRLAEQAESGGEKAVADIAARLAQTMKLSSDARLDMARIALRQCAVEEIPTLLRVFCAEEKFSTDTDVKLQLSVALSQGFPTGSPKERDRLLSSLIAGTMEDDVELSAATFMSLSKVVASNVGLAEVTEGFHTLSAESSLPSKKRDDVLEMMKDMPLPTEPRVCCCITRDLSSQTETNLHRLRDLVRVADILIASAPKSEPVLKKLTDSVSDIASLQRLLVSAVVDGMITPSVLVAAAQAVGDRATVHTWLADTTTQVIQRAAGRIGDVIHTAGELEAMSDALLAIARNADVTIATRKIAFENLQEHAPADVLLAVSRELFQLQLCDLLGTTETFDVSNVATMRGIFRERLAAGVDVARLVEAVNLCDNEFSSGDVSAFHEIWLDLLLALAERSRTADITGAYSRSSGTTRLTEEEQTQLYDAMGETDAQIAVALMAPYASLHQRAGKEAAQRYQVLPKSLRAQFLRRGLLYTLQGTVFFQPTAAALIAQADRQSLHKNIRAMVQAGATMAAGMLVLAASRTHVALRTPTAALAAADVFLKSSSYRDE